MLGVGVGLGVGLGLGYRVRGPGHPRTFTGNPGHPSAQYINIVNTDHKTLALSALIE